MTQVNGVSYLTDNSTYIDYFLRGDGADVHVRNDAYVNGQYRYTNVQTMYKLYGPASLAGHESFSLESYGRYAYNIDEYAFIPINVPNGTTITQIQVRVYDADGPGLIFDPDNNIIAGIYYFDRPNNEVYGIGGVAQQSTSGVNNYRTFTFNLSWPVNSSDQQFFIWMNFEEHSDEHRFCWARVQYNVSVAD